MVRSATVASLLLAGAASTLAAVQARNAVPGAYIVEFEDGHVSYNAAAGAPAAAAALTPAARAPQRPIPALHLLLTHSVV